MAEFALSDLDRKMLQVFSPEQLAALKLFFSSYKGEPFPFAVFPAAKPIPFPGTGQFEFPNAQPTTPFPGTPQPSFRLFEPHVPLADDFRLPNQ
jgi:hypothetical protein